MLPKSVNFWLLIDFSAWHYIMHGSRGGDRGTPPLENVGPRLKLWKIIVFFVINWTPSAKLENKLGTKNNKKKEPKKRPPP